MDDLPNHMSRTVIIFKICPICLLCLDAYIVNTFNKKIK